MSNPLCKRIILLKHMILASKAGKERLTLRDGKITHYRGTARAAAETKIQKRGRPSSLNPTISSSKDERAALEPVIDLLLLGLGMNEIFLLCKVCRRTAAGKK
ncbi:hypothetical protein ACLB2K_011300 [Fragaria x ananassa]